MRKSDVEKFVEKARGFEDMAKMNFEKQRYDLAMFCLEQAVQIYIKSKLLELVGEFPRTHDIVKLLRELDVVHNIGNFIDENFDIITKLIDAYITSRYYTREFYKEEVEKALEFLKRLKKVLNYD